jgi:CO/xanthine dehydrogenase Mo-binding subunit
VPRIHAELYAGKIINPRLCELQIEGATTFGLGQVLFEEVLQGHQWEHYQSESSDYMIPSFEDVPAELTVHMLEPHGVTDVHGVGETAIPPARPAIG